MIISRLAYLAVFALAIIVFCCSGANGLNLSTDIDAEDIPFEQIDEALEDVEDIVTVVWDYSRKYRQAIKGITGGLIFLYGANFPATLLMYQAASATGLPNVSKGLKELLKSYKQARKALKRELPQIIEAKKLLKDVANTKSDLTNRLQSLQHNYKSGAITKDELKDKTEEVKLELKVVQTQGKKLSAVSSSFKRIYSALDPQHIQGVLSSLYVSVLSVVAAASNQMLAKATIGLQLGRALSERLASIISKYSDRWQASQNGAAADSADQDTDLQVFFSRFMASNRAWVHTGVTSIATLAGLAAVQIFKHAIFVFSACTTGVKMVLDSTQDLVDPMLEALNLPTLANNPATLGVVQTAFVAIGVYLNISSGSAVPLIMKLILSPLYAVEIVFQTLFPSSLLRGLTL